MYYDRLNYSDAEKFFWIRFSGILPPDSYIRERIFRFEKIIQWDMSDQPKNIQYRQALKYVRKEISSLPCFLPERDDYLTIATFLDDLKDYADKIIVKRTSDIANHDTLWNTIVESFPFTRKTTRSHQQVLELWIAIRNTIISKRGNISTSATKVCFGKIVSVLSFAFSIFISFLFGGLIASYFQPHPGPFKLFLSFYIISVIFYSLRKGFLIKLFSRFISSVIFVLKVYFSVFLVWLMFLLLKRELEPPQILLLTLVVIALYEGINFYSKVAKIVIIAIVFLIKVYWSGIFIHIVGIKLFALYPDSWGVFFQFIFVNYDQFLLWAYIMSITFHCLF